MAVAPITEMEGMLSYKGAMQPIQVGGIDPAEEGKVSIVGQHIVQGRLEDLKPGEFGVVLMIGGNIPDKTRVVSVQIFDHVEAMEYSQAHWLAGAMLVFSFLVLLLLYAGRRGKAGWS